jgi:hypothetical protein
MGKTQKKEDNRDVFDKALDYAVPAAGAVAGGILGARLGGYSRKKFLKASKSEGRVVDKAFDRNGRQIGTDEQAAAARRAVDETDELYAKGAAGRIAGSAAGGVGGYEANRRFGRKERRK